MTINRHTLKRLKVAEVDIHFILHKVRSYSGVRSFAKMAIDEKNRMATTPHFDLIGLIEAHREAIPKFRSVHQPRNKGILKILKEVLAKLKKEEKCTIQITN